MNAPTDIPAAASPWKRWLVLGIIAVLVLVAGWFGARPAYRQFKHWRSERLAASAIRLLEQNDPAEAREKAHAALLLSPGNATALRAMAQALTRGTNAAALQFWSQLIQTGKASEADRRTFVEQTLRAGAAEAAGRELQKLLRETPDHAGTLWLASQWFTLIQQRDQAIEYAALAALRDPTNRQYKLFLSSLQFDAPEETQRLTARSNVWNRARDNDALGLEALVFLAQRRELTVAEKRELITRLQQHPSRNIAHELLALTLRITAEPGRRAGILDEAIAHYRNAEPQLRVRFAVWLNQNGETERTLIALPLEEALKRKDFFLPYVDAIAGLGRWTELRKILETKQSPMESTYVEAFQARCDAELKNDALAALHWRAALRAAERNPEQLLWLARYTEKCGEPEIARNSLRALIACVGNPLPAFRELQGLTERTGSTTELRDLLGEMVRRWPNDPTLQGDHAYLNLLLNTEFAASYGVASKLVAQFPESLPFRTTLALALYRQRDFKAALNAYGGRDYPWPSALPNQRAVFAAVLAANGQTREARQLMANLATDRLRPEEQALIGTLLR